MHRSTAILMCSALALACDSKPTDGSASAKPSQSAAKASASAPSSAQPKPSASAAPPPSPSASAGEDQGDGEAKSAKLESGEAFLKTWKLAEGSAPQPIAGFDGWHVMAPKDVAWPARGDKTKWGSVTIGGKPVAVLMASPEQDEGDQCFKLAEAKTKIGVGNVGGAKILSESTFEVPSAEKGDKTTTWGETIELLRWEKVEGQQGFYAHKVFDHGDDSTHVCCSVGSAEDGKDLKGLAEAAAIEPMVGLCMSTTFSF